MMKGDLHTILEKMKMASCEEKLKAYSENALSSLDQIRTRYEFCIVNLKSKAYFNMSCTTQALFMLLCEGMEKYWFFTSCKNIK